MGWFDSECWNGIEDGQGDTSTDTDLEMEFGYGYGCGSICGPNQNFGF